MKPTFNDVTWNIVENMVRGWAVIYDSIYVVTGPVFKNKDNIDTIGPHKIPVPDYFFKVVLVYNGIDMEAIGFILPNVDVQYETDKSAVSVDSVEKFTGLDFFYLLPDYLEQHLEAKLTPAFWQGNNNSFLLKQSMRRREVQCVATGSMDNRCTRMTLCLNATCNTHGCEGAPK
jgi:endonuclease G